MNFSDENIKILVQQKVLEFLKYLFVLGGIVSGTMFLLSLLMSWAHLGHYGLSAKNVEHAKDFISQTWYDPWLLFQTYAEGWNIILQSAQKGNFAWGMVFPYLVLIIVVLGIAIKYLRNRGRFLFSSSLEQQFASEQEIKSSEFGRGKALYLGMLGPLSIRLKEWVSVLLLGAKQTGKTASHVIPAILHADTTCIAAISTSGILAKYTSGYRAQFGPVFYFDWRLNDCPEKGQYWPKWNPLSQHNMPKRGKNRDKYLTFLVRSLLSQNVTPVRETYWERLRFSAMNGLLNFFIEKNEQAIANDYFLSRLMENGGLEAEEKTSLMSYYSSMSQDVLEKVTLVAQDDLWSEENYIPIGSWGGIPEQWQGRVMSLPMFADFLLYRYLLIERNYPQDTDCWGVLLNEMLEEASFFGYSSKVKERLTEINQLSKRQKNIIFPLILEPLTIFLNQTIRDRTSASDFYWRQLHGVRTVQKKWFVSTTYIVDHNDFMSRFFVDMLAENRHEAFGKIRKFPLLIVMDDLDQLQRYHALENGIHASKHEGVSFLLSTNGLQELQNHYGKETLENIISKMMCKVVTAESSHDMQQQLSNMAAMVMSGEDKSFSNYGRLRRMRTKNYLQKYVQLLEKCEDNTFFQKGTSLLLSETKCRRAIRLQALPFAIDGKMAQKAALNPQCFLLPEIIKNRMAQDANPPTCVDVIQNLADDLRSNEEIEAMIDIFFKKAKDDIKKLPDQISEEENLTDTSDEDRDNPKIAQLGRFSEDDADEWWMTESSFEVRTESEGENSQEEKPQE